MFMTIINTGRRHIPLQTFIEQLRYLKFAIGKGILQRLNDINSYQSANKKVEENIQLYCGVFNVDLLGI